MPSLFGIACAGCVMAGNGCWAADARPGQAMLRCLWPSQPGRGAGACACGRSGQGCGRTLLVTGAWRLACTWCCEPCSTCVGSWHPPPLGGMPAMHTGAPDTFFMQFTPQGCNRTACGCAATPEHDTRPALHRTEQQTDGRMHCRTNITDSASPRTPGGWRLLPAAPCAPSAHSSAPLL